MIRVMIADDHAIVREGIRQILLETDDLVPAHEAGCASEVLDEAMARPYDVILLDISMPGRGGLEVLKQLKSLRPEVRVLILTMHPEEQYAIRALRAGASGYLTKSNAPDELIAAIRKIAAGQKYVTPTLAQKLADVLEEDPRDPLHESLSDREFQVLRMIASGRTVTEIAEELSLSVKTISTYRARVLVKLKMRTNAELTHYAFQNHLVE
jgi:DNA-binding NarL/FixJ family response regulator